MPQELAEAFSEVSIVNLAKRLHELRHEISALKGEEENIARILRNHISTTGEIIEAEGIPALKLRDVGSGWYWDSSAVRNLVERHPKEWERLMELGAVALNSTVVNTAIKAGQLMGRPEGGQEKRIQKLEFEKQ